MPDSQRIRPRNLTSVPDVARYYGISERTVRRRIAEGALTAYRIGPRIIRVDADEVETLFELIPTTDPAA